MNCVHTFYHYSKFIIMNTVLGIHFFFTVQIQVFKPVASATHISNSVGNDCVIQERR